jgi:hypothetical protein
MEELWSLEACFVQKKLLEKASQKAYFGKAFLKACFTKAFSKSFNLNKTRKYLLLPLFLNLGQL